jgi:hypothetical protein
MKKAAPLDYGKAPRQQTEPAPAPVFKAPLQRRPGVFIALLGVLSLWVVALAILYVRTVHSAPKSHAAPANESTTVERTISR